MPPRKPCGDEKQKLLKNFFITSESEPVVDDHDLKRKSARSGEETEAIQSEAVASSLCFNHGGEEVENVN